MTRAAWESPPDSAFSGPALVLKVVSACFTLSHVKLGMGFAHGLVRPWPKPHSLTMPAHSATNTARISEAFTSNCPSSSRILDRQRYVAASVETARRHA